MSLLLRGVTITDSRQALAGTPTTVRIADDGTIVAMGEHLSPLPEDQVIEAGDLYLAPAFVDVLADYREPGYEHKETLDTGLQAALAGGFGHVMLAPNTLPAMSTRNALQHFRRVEDPTRPTIHPYGAISQNIEGKALAEMLDMHEGGAVAFSDGWKPVQHTNLMLKALEYVRAMNGVLMQIPIDEALSSGGLMHEGPMSTRLGMPGIPDLGETLILHRDIALLRYTQSRLHVSGVATAAGLDMIRAAKAEGLDITCSVTPYHLALTDAAMKDYDSVYKVSPVLRSEADRQACIAALADGTIDCIATHHRPQEWDSKAKELEYAGDGIALQELAFPVIWHSVQGLVSFDRLIDAMSIRPRAIFGLPPDLIDLHEKPAMVLISLSNTTLLDRMQVRSRSANNPFLGQTLQGKIRSMILNGKITTTII